jgi:hypothetical protein
MCVCSVVKECTDITNVEGSGTYKAYFITTQHDEERLVPGSS